MKKQTKSLLLLLLLVGMSAPAWGQASTEGKEFWVALNMTTGTGGDTHEPFICITTQHQGGSYTITNPADPSFQPITGQIPRTGYIKIMAKENPGPNEIDLKKWYPVGKTAPNMSCQTQNVGLKVTTTVESSVFVGNRLPQSFDAANILPITALQTDYITQDYPGYDHGGSGMSDGGFPEITILATENNTTVTINPSSAVLNSNGTATITKTLNAGQVLYITGENRATLSGTNITSNKKIAVFTGVNNTDIPGPVSARDHLYEQNMPIDYWGTHFVVTRSMKKDANRIRVTASNNGTEISIDGYSITTINAGETYEFELCESAMRSQSAYTNAVAQGRGTEVFLDGEAHYLETSCPCAVYSYDVSEKYYISSGTSDVDQNSAGDPAMVWISPLEQQLRKVTFGVMNTDQTPTHYVNIITPTKGAASLEVREIAMSAGQVVYGNNLVQPTDVKPVPANPLYSYARIKLTDNVESVYTITSSVGFIAHVYGSGNKESYAYSCGSAAVQQGVNVNGETFINGYRSDSKFCIADVIEFDASVGTDEISRVDWTFGDGTSNYNSTPQVTHQYLTPGWYDVTAALYGRQVCTNESEQFLGSVQFSFRVVRADTVPMGATHDCIERDSTLNGVKLTAAQVNDLLTNGKNDTAWAKRVNCYDPVEVTYVYYDIETEETLPTIVGQDFAVGYNGKTYLATTEVEDTIVKPNGCRHFKKYQVKVLTCLGLTITNDSAAQHVCQGDPISIDYVKTKGDLGNVQFVCGNLSTPISMSNDNTSSYITLPTESLKPGIYKAVLKVEDIYCDNKEYPLDIAVYYPSNIFKYKFNNVLVVYNPGYGGNEGYDFVAYQWYRNGVAIDPLANPTATTPAYHTDEPFTRGDEYYVMLTDKKGMTLQSCPLTIESVPEYLQLDEPAAAAHKLINRNHMFILRDGQLFNIFGQRVR